MLNLNDVVVKSKIEYNLTLVGVIKNNVSVYKDKKDEDKLYIVEDLELKYYDLYRIIGFYNLHNSKQLKKKG